MPFEEICGCALVESLGESLEAQGWRRGWEVWYGDANANETYRYLRLERRGDLGRGIALGLLLRGLEIRLLGRVAHTGIDE